MQRIVAHIERLLLNHDCVIIPGLGGFVLQTVASVYSVEEHVFRPTHKDLLFNSKLKHQDGLLTESYMKMYSVDYRKAVEMVEQDVEVLLRRLNENNRLDLGSIGMLHVGHEGQFIFTSDGSLQGGSAYGLPTFYFTPLSLLKKEQDELFIPHKFGDKKKDTIYIRINRSFVRVSAAVAAVAAFVLLVSTPIKDVNPLVYTASFIPSEITAGKPAEQVAPEVNLDESVVESPVETPVETEITPEADLQPVATPVVTKTGKTYYAVIGSFPDEEAGNKFMDQIDKALYPKTGSVKKGNYVRVYSEKFDNREDAESYISTLRLTDKYKDAWLFISR